MDAAISDFRQALKGLCPSLAFAFQPIGEGMADLLPQEAAHLSPNAVLKRRQEFQAGRAAARSALSQIGVSPIAIPKGDKGQPIWPKGAIGSITHTAQLAIAAACPAAAHTGIGIDLELEQRFKPDLAEAILTQAEWDGVQSNGGDWGAYFSAKEATYKAIFGTIGKVIGFQDVELTFSDSDNAFSAAPVTGFSHLFPVGRPFLQGHILRTNGMILSISVFS